MSYYLLPPNTQALQTLKQCLHFDPDSKPCRTSHRAIKAFDKEFTKLDNLEQSSSWASLLRLIVGAPSTSSDPEPPSGFAAKFDAALDDATGPSLNLPASIHPRKVSPRRLRIYSLACKAYLRSNQINKASDWCEETLKIDENDLDGLLGRAEVKLKAEEWEEAVRAFEKAFEASGRSNQEVMIQIHSNLFLISLTRGISLP